MISILKYLVSFLVIMCPTPNHCAGEMRQSDKTNGLYYKTFRIVIYDRNDTSHYYKTTIIAKALASPS